MSQLDKDLGYFEDLFRKMRYDEGSLQSYDKPGIFMRQLRYKYGYAVRMALQSGEIEGFDVGTTGFFRDDRDIVQFRAFFEYNPEVAKLSFTKLTAKMDGKEMEFKISDNPEKELPISSDVHRLFLKSKILKNTISPAATHESKRKGLKP